MKTIPSFTIDHIRLLRGIYVSRKDEVGGETVTRSDKIVYWGPMGCLTGNYLLMKGDLKSEDIIELMQETFRFVADFEGEVPGAAPKDCGNYLLHDLPMAKWESAKYLHEVLEHMTKDNLYYPTKE